MADTAADDYPGARAYVPADADLDDLRAKLDEYRAADEHRESDAQSRS